MYAAILKWDEDQHPRAPSGGSDGGQFTSEGEGSVVGPVQEEFLAGLFSPETGLERTPRKGVQESPQTKEFVRLLGDTESAAGEAGAAAINKYTSNDSRGINAAAARLADGVTDPSDGLRAAQALDDVFAHASPTKVPLMLFRGFSGTRVLDDARDALGMNAEANALNPFEANKLRDAMKAKFDALAPSLIGRVFTEKGFSSASANKEWADGFRISGFSSQVTVPKGSKVIVPGQMSVHPEEQEAILPRGTRYKITGARWRPEEPPTKWSPFSPFGRPVLDLQVLPAPHSKKKWDCVFKFNPNHDERGRFAEGPGSSAAGFVSPNVKEGGHVAEAQADLSSPRHIEVAKMSHDVDQILGLRSTHADVVGAWKDGAEDSLMVWYNGRPSFDEVRLSMAMKGLLADQKMVVPFKTGAGPDSMYHLDVPEHDMTKLNHDLVGMGLEYHTMEAHSGGTRVWIFDEGSNLKQQALEAGKRYGTSVKRWKGQGELLGSFETREEGRQKYEEVIADAGRRGILGHDGSRRWEGLRDRWRSTHPAIKAALAFKGDLPGHEFHGNQYSGVDTSSATFKDWFKDSKVVDKGGAPLRVFHGTTADFTEFRPGPSWFSSDPNYASIYGGPLTESEGVGGNVLPLYVSAQNPKIFDASSDGMMKWANGPTDQATRQQGHDAVLFMSHGKIKTGYTFEPEQIKSAVSNSGEFSRRARSILKGDLPGHEFHGNQWTDPVLQQQHDTLITKPTPPMEVKREITRQMLERSLTVYHGTESKIVASVMKNGLVPNASPGADSWADKNGLGSMDDENGARVSVYATPVKELAANYANLATSVAGPGAKPVMFEIHVPKARVKDFVVDIMDSRAVAFKGTIPPEWIKKVPFHKVRGAPLIAKPSLPFLIKTDDTVYYVLVMVKDPAQKWAAVLKWDESQHPRAPAGTAGGGQFTSGGGGELAGYSKDAEVRGGKIYTDNVEDAVRALYQDRDVVLDQPREVSTLLDRLAAIGADAKAKGESAPTYNLCRVSVAGSNLFCAESKGIPRVQMPQLKGEPLPGSLADKMPRNSMGEVDLSAAFRDDLMKSGVKIVDADEGAAYLRASQNELNGLKVAGIMHAIHEHKLLDERLFISKDNYVVDGHHRWAAQVAVDGEDGHFGDLKLKIARVDMGIIELLHRANAFAKKMGIPQATMYKYAAILKWDEAQHPREPAGSVDGGRFAAAQAQGFDTSHSYYHGTPHGMDGFEFRTPDGSTKGHNESSYIGTWFTDKPAVANSFTLNEYNRHVAGAVVIPVFLGLKNPKVYEGPSAKELKVQEAKVKLEEAASDRAGHYLEVGPERQKLREMQRHDPFEQMMDERDQFAEYIDHSVHSWRSHYVNMNAVEASLKFRQKLIDEGHDGIVLKNTVYDAPRKGTQVMQVAVFDTKDIRSPFARFDPKHRGETGLLKWDEGLHLRDDHGRFETMLRMNTGKFSTVSDADIPLRRGVHPDYNKDKTGYPTRALDKAARHGFGVHWTNGELAKFMASVKRKSLQSIAAILKWDESQHPRSPSGTSEGGWFTSEGAHADVNYGGQYKALEDPNYVIQALSEGQREKKLTPEQFAVAKKALNSEVDRLKKAGLQINFDLNLREESMAQPMVDGLTSTNPDDPNSVEMFIDTSNQITTEHFERMQKQKDKVGVWFNVAMEHWPDEDAFWKGIARHELAHALIDEPFVQWVKKNKDVLGLTPREMAHKVSTYASTEATEGIAEVFGKVTDPKYVKGTLPRGMELLAEKLIEHSHHRGQAVKMAAHITPRRPEDFIVTPAKDWYAYHPVEDQRIAQKWDEMQHPRAPAGGADGGQFTIGSLQSAAPDDSGRTIAGNPIRINGVHVGGMMEPSMQESMFESMSSGDNLLLAAAQPAKVTLTADEFARVKDAVDKETAYLLQNHVDVGRLGLQVVQSGVRARGVGGSTLAASDAFSRLMFIDPSDGDNITDDDIAQQKRYMSKHNGLAFNTTIPYKLKGDTDGYLRAIVRHEMGHVVTTDTFDKWLMKNWDKNGYTPDWAENSISKYAGSHPHEFVAEVFQKVMAPEYKKGDDPKSEALIDKVLYFWNKTGTKKKMADILKWAAVIGWPTQEQMDAPTPARWDFSKVGL